MIEHRLPLFLRSDLYSEYKISKLLTTPALDMPINAWRNVITPSQASHQLQSIASRKSVEVNDMESQMKTSGLSLPDIGISGNECSIKDTTSTIDLNKHSPVIAASKSDVILESKSSRKRVKWQRSLSVEQELLSPTSPLVQSLTSGDSGKIIGVKSCQYLATKSGMSAFWKFLKGKAGERNLLFWLDAERITYYKNSLDQQR